jgi:hypothetical protein
MTRPAKSLVIFLTVPVRLLIGIAIFLKKIVIPV